MNSTFRITVERPGGGSSGLGSSPASGSPSPAQLEREAKAAQTAAEKLTKSLEEAYGKRAKSAEAAAKKEADSYTALAKKRTDDEAKAAAARQAAYDKATKSAEAAAKKAADTQAAEAQRASDAALKYAQIQENAYNKLGAAQARAAKKAADDEIKERDRVAKETEKENKRQLSAIGSAVSRAGSAAGGGIHQAGQTIGAGVSGAVSGIASGGILGLPGSIPRAAGDLVSSGITAGAQFASGIVKGVGALASLLPGPLGIALSGVAGIVSGAFSVVGELASGLAKAAGQIAGFIGDKLGTALEVTLGAAVAVGIAGLHAALKAEDVDEYFKSFSGGAEAAEAAIKKLRAATLGEVSDFQLKIAANETYLNLQNATIDDIAKLAVVARQTAKALNTDFAGAFKEIEGAIGGLQSRGLKKILGPESDVNAAIARFAEQAGIPADKLSTATKQAIGLQTVLAAAANKLDLTGAAIQNTNDKLRTSIAGTENDLEKIGKTLTGAFGKVLDAINPVIVATGQFFDNNKVTITEKLTKAVSGLGGALDDVASFAAHAKLSEIGDVLVQAFDVAWAGIKLGAVKTVEFVKTTLVSGIRSALGDTASGFLGIPEYAAGKAPQFALGKSSGDIPLKFGGTTFGQGGDSFLTHRQLDINEAVEQKRQYEIDAAKANEAAAATEKAAADEFSAAVNRLKATLSGIVTRPEELPASQPVQPPDRVEASGLGRFDATGTSPNEQPVVRQSPSASQVTGTTNFKLPSSGDASHDAELIAQGQAMVEAGKDFLLTFTSGIEDLQKADAIIKLFVDHGEYNNAKLAKLGEEIGKQDVFKNAEDALTEDARAMLFIAEDEKQQAIAIKESLGSLKSIENAKNSEIKKVEADALKEKSRILEDSNKQLDQIGKEFAAEMKAAFDDVQAKIRADAKSLQGAAGFGNGPFGGADLNAAIPLKVKSAAAKQQRRATRALKHELNQRVAGLGQDDIIDQQDDIFRDVSTSFSKGEGEFAGVHGAGKAAGDLEAQQLEIQRKTNEELQKVIDEKDAALTKLGEQTNTAIEGIKSTFESQTEAFTAARDKISDLNDYIKSVKKDVDDIKKSLNNLQVASR